jgi:predicted transglutaminase-like cysteine proteinase
MGRRLLIILASILSTTSLVNAGPYLFGEADAPPLPAWTEFCGRGPAECMVDTNQPETLTWTQELYTLLSFVNRSVNSALIPATDESHWGISDLWGYPTDGIGDCEDYQLLKRKLLINAGLPRRPLLMTVVIDEKGEGHAVLTIRTDRGDLILDNKTDEVLEWFKTSYTFIKRESADAVGWVYLTHEPENTLLTSASDK